MLTDNQIETYRTTGHLTVPGVFSDEVIAAAIRDIEQWGADFLQSLTDSQRSWYLERTGASGELQSALRKLDNPRPTPVTVRAALLRFIIFETTRR